MQNRLALLVCCLAVLVVLVFPLDSHAQEDPYVAFGDGQIADLRSEMHEHMSSSEVSLDESIHYYTVHSSEINAGARMHNGRREIIVNSAMLEAIDDLATMETIAFLWNREDCFASYSDYMGDLADSNAELLLQGMSGHPLIKPFPYLYSHKGICPQLSPDIITNDEKHAGGFRTIAIRESIKWVLLHEFAHHLHGDVLQSTANLSEAKRLEISRGQETAADNYAFQAMINPPELPSVAVPVIVLFCSQEHYALVNEKSDHPEAVRRLKGMMDAARSSPQWDKTLHKGTPAQQEQIRAMLDDLDRSVKAQK
jgi:hypothetical protein